MALLPGEHSLVLETGKHSQQILVNTVTHERAPLPNGPFRLVFSDDGHGILEKVDDESDAGFGAQSKLQYAAVDSGGHTYVVTDRGKETEVQTHLHMFFQQHNLVNIDLNMTGVQGSNFDAAQFSHSNAGCFLWCSHLN